MLNGAVWAPLVLLFFLRAIRGQRPVASAAWSGTFLGIAFLGGNLQIPVLICLAIIAAWVYLALGRFKILLIFFLFLFLVAALELLPAWRFGTLAQRPVGLQNPFSLVAVCLALLGVTANREDRVARLFAGIALAGLLPFAGFMFHFGLSVLIAYGIDGYRRVEVRLKKAVIVLLCIISAAAAFLIWIMHTTKSPTDPRLGIILLVGFFLAGTLNAWDHARITAGTAVAALGLLLLFDLGNVITYDYQARAETKSLLMSLSEHSDIATFLSHQIGPVRVEVDTQDIPYNFGDWYGIDQLGVGANTQAAALYATNFHVSRSPKRPDQVEVFTGRSGVKVFENPAAFRRVRIVHSPPPLQNCDGNETVSLVSRRASRVALQADLKCRGMVVEADAFSPDWVATVDGKSAPIYDADGFLGGVVVEAGSHRIEMRYRPKSVYCGAALTVLGLLGAIALTVRHPILATAAFSGGS
jgi:hypothetical protein